MGILVSGPEVVAFLEWLRKSFPDLRSAGEILPSSLRNLAERFVTENFDPTDLMDPNEIKEEQYSKWFLNQAIDSNDFMYPSENNSRWCLNPRLLAGYNPQPSKNPALAI